MKKELLLFGLQLLSAGVLAQGRTISSVSSPNHLWAVPEKLPPMVMSYPAIWSANSFLRQRPAWVSHHHTLAEIIVYRYTYNAAGRITLMVAADSLTGQFHQRQVNTYDAQNRLVGVTGEMRTSMFPAPLTTSTYAGSYTYDAHGNLTRTESSTFISENSYTYDAAGTITSLTRYTQQPGQPRQLVGRSTFTLQNGRWQSSNHEEYQNGTLVRRRKIHRYNWQNWPLRRLNGSRWTDSLSTTISSEGRDTVQYTRVGTDTVVVRTSQFLYNGSWRAAAPYRARFDAPGNLVASNSYFHQDSSTFHYTAQHQLQCQRTWHYEFAPAMLALDLTTYYAVGTVNAAPPPAAPRLTLNPNPAARFLTLTATDLPGRDAPAEVEVLNALGQVVARRRVRPSAGTLTETWDVQVWPAGVYVLRLRGAAGTIHQRFLKP
jgi:YD repeat-containing protein